MILLNRWSYSATVTILMGVLFSMPSAAQEGAAPAQGQQPPPTPYKVSPEAYQYAPATGCLGCPPDRVFGAPPPAPVAPINPAPRRVGPIPNQPNPLLYDLLLHGGHVIDAKNHIDKVTDIAIKDGKIAAAGDNLRVADAAKTIDVSGYYVTPGLVDIHTHVYPIGAFELPRASDTVETPGQFPITSRMFWHTIWPDGFTLRTGTTTIVDAGSAGWRNFEDFKEHIIDRSITRVYAMLNIVGAGMRGDRYENNLTDMDGTLTGAMAKRYPSTIVGIKSAHFTGPEWKPYVEAVKAGTVADIPVMIDYGSNRIERPMAELVTKYLRPGDIYTHTYSGLRSEQDTQTLKPSDGLLGGRAHGVYFDAGTGQGSFRFRVAVPLLQAGFKPDSLSTDIHIDSMNSSTKDILNVMGKFMAMGETLQEVVEQSTWHPAREIKHEELGNLSVGVPADVAVFDLQHGSFGFTDMDAMKMMGDKRLICELTVHDGRVVYDLDGLSMDVWNKPPTANAPVAAHWTVFVPRPPLPDEITPTKK